MTAPGLAQLALYAVALVVLAVPLGAYMARVHAGRAHTAQRLLGGSERLIYRLCGVDATAEMSWQRYALALLLFNLVGVVVVYALMRLQGVLPGNPLHLPAVAPRLAFNTAISFATNTDWQAYGGETTLSLLVQAAALTVQNFVSAATGMAVLVALTRGFGRRNAAGVGNLWVDLTRSIVYILLPLAIVTALALVWQGVPQTADGRVTVTLVDPQPAPQPDAGASAPAMTTTELPLGPVASQVAIKQLGTNGGGFYNANAAHPLENPTPLASFLECLAILLVPTALCFTFGHLLGARRQGVALLVTMALLTAPFLAVTVHQEQAGNPALTALDVDQAASSVQAGGNLEGKEVRFGVAASALWAVTTTAASNGSVNSMHDSYTPLGGLAPLVLIQLGEVAFGGVGSGLYGLLVFALVAVFIAGLMVGRTPELLGKKIEAFEMKMALLAILVPVATVLGGTAAACLVDETYGALANRGAHGFSELLYAFSSLGNNNGSAFAGLDASHTFLATVGGVCMWIARYGVIIPVLAIAGSLARKRTVPPSAGTLPTDGPLFVVLLAGAVLLVGALSFVPALALGPLAEHLALHP